VGFFRSGRRQGAGPLTRLPGLATGKVEEFNSVVRRTIDSLLTKSPTRIIPQPTAFHNSERD